MQAAKWDAAAALGLRSDLKIAADTVLSRSDDEAPVSNLYLFGRKEDLAFEQPVGDSPRKRNHVRFWRTPQANSDGRPIWIGSATYDERVGLSHTTGQITHRIAPDVDAERDHLFADLKQTGELSEVYDVDHFHTVLEGRNGGGDVWRTDGRLMVGVIKPGDAPGNANRLHLVAKTKKTPDPRITIMIDAFDIFAFVVFGVLGCVVLFIVVTLGALPGKIATKRGHPHAAAITAAGFLPF
jgi:hypothetical protein